MWHASRLDSGGGEDACWVVPPSMRRYALIILGVLVAVWAILAVALGSPNLTIGDSGSQDLAASPPCDLASPERSAQLPGTRVYASPAPGTDTANPRTQISFLGAADGDIHGLSVVGSASGHHEGRLAAYSQGDGASFVPAKPFTEN